MPRPPLVLSVRRLALEDGPGLRTTVFMKGCPLSCVWCHNPESQNLGPDLAFFASRCIGCGKCKKICPEGAIDLEGPERVLREQCNLCGLCARQCPSGALSLLGKAYSPQELAADLETDILFFETSGGGVTFSGGEPGLFPEYLGEVAGRLKERGLHIAMQTAGMFHLQRVKEALLPQVDLVYFELKLAGEAEHRQYTGLDNRLIRANFQALCEEPDVRLIPRITLVPGITAGEDNLDGLVGFIKSCGLEECELLSYHPGGLEMVTALGREASPSLPDHGFERDELEKWRDFVEERLSA